MLGNFSRLAGAVQVSVVPWVPAEEARASEGWQIHYSRHSEAVWGARPHGVTARAAAAAGRGDQGSCGGITGQLECLDLAPSRI